MSRLCLLRYPPILTPHPRCLYPHTLTHHLPYGIDTSLSLPPHTYTSPSILPYTYTSVPYPVSPEPMSIVVHITLSSHPLPSHTLPPWMTPFLTFYLSGVDFQLGDLVLDMYIDYFIHQLSRLHQLPLLHKLLQLCLRLHETLLPNKLFILGVVLREI